MRVLVVEGTVFGYDGITNVITSYYRYLDHKRIQMDLVTINPVSELFKKEMDSYNSKCFVLPYRNSNPLKYVYELKKIIQKGRYSIVHAHGCSATMAVEMLAAKLAGVKVRISHSHNTQCNHVKADRMLRPFFKRLCNVRYACGREAGKWMFPDQSFTVISNGVDLEKYQYNEAIRQDMRDKYRIADKFVVGHVGRFSEQKNHTKLIDVFSKLSGTYPDSKLVLVGDGELKQVIAQKVQNEKLDVLFVGLSNEVDKWLQAMDVIVFPSLFEGLPLFLMEAQAAGLPCILSDTISPSAKITDLVEFVDLGASPAIWSEAVERIRDKYDRKLRIEDVKKQIRKAHFDIRENCKDLCEMYEVLVHDGGLK